MMIIKLDDLVVTRNDNENMEGNSFSDGKKANKLLN